MRPLIATDCHRLPLIATDCLPHCMQVREGVCGDHPHRMQPQPLCAEQPVPMLTILLSVGGTLLGTLALAMCVYRERRNHGRTRVRLEELEIDAALEVRDSWRDMARLKSLASAGHVY